MIKVQKNRGRYSNSLTGTYYPLNRKKFLGESLPVFKSNLERKFMLYADRNPNIIAVSYEGFHINYIDTTSSPPKPRKYYIDFILYVRTPTGTPRKIWVEVKMSKEVKKPTRSKNPMDMQIWLKNQCKWNAAIKLARQRGVDFKIITDKELD